MGGVRTQIDTSIVDIVLVLQIPGRSQSGKFLPFDGDSQSDEEGGRVRDVLQGIDELGPQIDVDRCLVGDKAEALLQGVLHDGKDVEEGVEAAQSHDQLVEYVVQADLAQNDHRQNVPNNPNQAQKTKTKKKGKVF